MAGERNEGIQKLGLGGSRDGNEDEVWTLDKIATNLCLCDLQKMLAAEDKSLDDFGLPMPNLEKKQFC